MEIYTKEDLNEIVKLVVENKAQVTEKYEFFISLKNYLKEFFLKRGDIPPSFYVDLYFVFKDLDIEKDEYIEKTLNVLENYYKNASEEEKVLLNNVILILSIFNGENYLKKYLIRGMITNPYLFLNNEEFNVFKNFCNKLESDEIINTVREYLKNFFSFDELERKTFYINILDIFWNIEKMHNNKKWLELKDDFVTLLNELIEKNMIEEQMYMHFLFYHIYGNNVQTIKEWKWFNDKVEKPASEFYKKWGENNNLPKCKNKISKKKKIAFLIDRIVLNSPLMVTYSLIKNLLNDNEFRKKYEIYIYSMTYIEKQNDDKKWIKRFEDLGCKVILPEDFLVEGMYVSHLKKALWIRDKILENKIDYLISGFGYDIPNFIFSNRSAPKQIFWSHGNCTSEIENIDLKISHFNQECGDDWKIFNVSIDKEFLIGDEEDRKKADILKNSFLETYGKNTVFLGTIGRLVKIDSDEYIKTVAKILKQNPNTLYFACGAGNIDSIKEKLKKYDIPESRFVFTGQVNPHVFGWVIDIWLDSFPLRQGHSLVEAQAKGGAIVHYAPVLTQKDIDNMKNAYKEGEQDLNLKLPFYPIAENKDEYIKFADYLIKNDLDRRNVGDCFKKSLLKQLENPDISKFLEIINEN